VSPATAEVETSASQWDTAEKAFRETAKEGKDQPSLLWSFALSRTWMRAHVALDSLVDAVSRLKAASAAEAQAEAALTDAKFLEVQSAGSAACAERGLVKAQSEALIDPAIQHRDNPLWWAEDDGLVRIVLRGLARALALGAAAFLDQGAWLIAVVPVAVVLALGALSIAHATSDTRFFWTGVALFVSGLLFGACFTLLRTDDAPKLQPVGVLLNPTAGQACGTFLSGAYVARTGSKDDDRIYFGNADRVSNDRNTYDFLNGRLTSVPNSEVAAHAVGSLVNPYSGSPAFDTTVRGPKEDLEKQAGCSR